MTTRTLPAVVLTTALALVTSVDAQQSGRRNVLISSIQGFNVVLVVGESQSTGRSPDEIPAAAQRALHDMREFLPYKHYRVLDSQWTSCCAESTRASVAGRLQGITGVPAGNGNVNVVQRPYSFAIHASEYADKLQVRFSLRQDDGAAAQGYARTDAQRLELESRIRGYERDIADLRQKGLEPSHPRVQETQSRLGLARTQLQQWGRDTREGRSGSIIDSSFTMDIGETVVVGTSRVGGDKALIALVTAARKPTARR